MAFINTKSIFFRLAVLYVFVTILNVSIFMLMVFENQIDLIIENATLNSLHIGSNLKYRIENIVGPNSAIDINTVKKILKEASSLGIKDVTVFGEGGKVFVSVKNNQPVQKEEADIEELKTINTAITKRDFEQKLFYHKVHKNTKTIDLYIPINYERDKIAVIAITHAMKDIDKQFKFLIKQCIVIAFLIVIVHLAFAGLVSKMILFPLKKLNEATKLISGGNLEIRVPIVRDDEIGQLASSFNEMSVALQRMRDEAKGANPLTGLPGNITIAKYIDEQLVKGNIIAVMYCDLDNFKAYNDKYGFTKGDEAICYTRDCLLSVAKRYNLKDIFIGHEGGDDFVVVCPFDYWEQYVKVFITTFDRGIYQFYSSIDARNGFIESINRKGERQRFPLMSVSVAVVSNKFRPFRRHAEMIQVAAEVKKYVKSIDGSCYAIDRRSGPVNIIQDR